METLVSSKLFTEIQNAGDALDYSVEMLLFLELAKEEHVTKYKEVDKAGRELLDARAILSQRRLSRSLFSDQRLKDILTQVDKMVKKNYPDYELATIIFPTIETWSWSRFDWIESFFDSDLSSVYKRFQTTTLVTL